MTNRLLNLLPDVTDMIRRFPVAAIVAVITCVAMNLQVVWNTRFELAMDWYVNGAVAFVGAGVGHLFAEGRRWSAVQNFLAAVVGAGVSGAICVFYDTFQTFEGFLILGLWLLLMVAAYLRSSATQGALWFFNMKLHLAGALAFVVGMVFGVGLSVVVAGLDFLLGVSFEQSAYEHIWYTATTLVGPLYGLSLVPSALDEQIDIDDHKGTLIERALSMVVNYVLVPLVIVYALILHAYAVKIIFNWGLPKGEIGIIVSLFAAGGTATWLLAWPWREKGTRLLRLFMRGWFWLMPVPVVLLVMAIGRRVSDYGITPERYGIGLVALWAVIVFVYLTWRRNRADMRVLVGSAAVLLLASSFGPQGAFAVTTRDQMARLTEILEKSGVVAGGKFVKKADMQANGAALQNTYSIVSTLASVRGLDGVYAWFGGDAGVKKGEGRYGQLSEYYPLTEQLGLNTSYQQPDSVAISASGTIDFKIDRASRLIGPVYLPVSADATIATSPNALPPDMKVVYDKKEFRLTVGAHVVAMPMVDFMTKLKTFDTGNNPVAKVPVMELDGKVTLLINSAYGRAGNDPELNSIYVWIVVKE